VDRITRLAVQVMDKYKDKFTTDFTENKKTLDQVAVIRSKGLKNEIAGYITKFVKRESFARAQKQQLEAERAAELAAEEKATQETATEEMVDETAEDVSEDLTDEDDEETESEDIVDEAEPEQVVMEDKPQEST